MEQVDHARGAAAEPGGRGDVVVVGAGISGLTAAFRLQRQGWDVTVLEAADHVGGKMASRERDGYVLNRGATMIPQAFTALTRLCADVGLGDPFTLMPLSFGIPRDGTVLPLGGAGVAAAVRGIRTDLLSWRSKLLLRRLLTDMLRWRRRLGHDDFEAAGRLDTESVASYAERRLNQEIYDYVIDPLLRGVYLSEPSRMSVVDFFLTVGKFAEGGPMQYPTGIDFLAKRLASLVRVRTGAAVTSITRTESGVRTVWRDATGEHAIESRGCVIAVDGPTVLRLCPELPERQRELIGSIPYGSVLKGIFGLRRDPEDLPTMVAVPSSAGIGLGIINVDSRAMPNAVPPGKAVVSGHWVDGYARKNTGRSDKDLIPEMIRDMERLIPGFADDLEFAEIERWDTATNARCVGFYRTVAELRSSADPDAIVQLAGDYLGISGTNSSAEAGERAAKSLGRRLASLHGDPRDRA
ncbi:protoporphyrinogen/coproporphyrinogen oxidase [Streptomyces sp. B21-083]|uniref:protoporphyrinogen/coproporphyrinogen oxidase n=1 Tax=Streptomyces sp. B21-083 TaxID=3039410 RepID=UPI002FEEA334